MNEFTKFKLYTINKINNNVLSKNTYYYHKYYSTQNNFVNIKILPNCDNMVTLPQFMP